MSNDKKPRTMTIKGFLHKASGKAANSAEAFINFHRAFLSSGELAPLTSHILARVDAGETMPTPALDEIRTIVLAHSIQSAARAAEEKMLAEPKTASQKPWSVTLFTAKGEVATKVNAEWEVIELSQNFDLQQRASEWADRRLTQDCSADCFGVIIHTPTSLEVVVLYVDAMGRQNPKAKSPFSKKTGSRDNKLSFGVKAGNDRAHFSHG